jgi:hypothetical protein
VTLSSSIAPIEVIGYGYQFLRKGSGSLWVEIPVPLIEPHQRTSILPGSVDMDSSAFLPGLRFMVPVQTRVSLYGVAGGGVGFFSLPSVHPGNPAQVLTPTAIHGAFDFAGGADLRLNRRFSFRIELMDLVTGRGLSGVAGPNHLVPTAGLAYHF